MDSGVLVFIVVIFWVIPILASVALGLEKGRALAGLAYGFLFGVFGLLVTAMLEPSDAIRRQRADQLAEAIAVAMQRAEGQDDVATRDCPACMTSVSRRASICRACGRDLPPYLDAAEGPFEGDLSVEVVLAGCTGATDEGAELLIVVEPGWITINACTDECTADDHELLLSVNGARDLLNRFLTVSQEHSKVEFTVDGDVRVVLDWEEGDEGYSCLTVDWTRQFLSAGDQLRHESGETISCAYHGVLLLDGELAERSSEVSLFENALAVATDLSATWQSGRLTRASAVSALSAVGKVVN